MKMYKSNESWFTSLSKGTLVSSACCHMTQGRISQQGERTGPSTRVTSKAHTTEANNNKLPHCGNEVLQMVVATM